MRRVLPKRAAPMTKAGGLSDAIGANVCASTTSKYSACAPGAMRAPASRRLRLTLAPFERGTQREQRAMERRRLRALMRVEIGVAARERQAVCLAHGFDDLDARGNIQIPHDAPQDGRLLRVLLADVEHVGGDDLQELHDDRRDAIEMARPNRALVAVARAPALTRVENPSG